VAQIETTAMLSHYAAELRHAAPTKVSPLILSISLIAVALLCLLGLALMLIPYDRQKSSPTSNEGPLAGLLGESPAALALILCELLAALGYPRWRGCESLACRLGCRESVKWAGLILLTVKKIPSTDVIASRA
jgi:uncharacterized membrane protein